MEGNSEEYNCNYNLYEFFCHFLQTHPEVIDEPALLKQENVIKYGELNERIVKLSSWISSNLFEELKEAESRVIGIHVRPDLDTVPLLLSIHRLNCAYLPIDPIMPEKTIEHIINDSKPLAIVTNLDPGEIVFGDMIKQKKIKMIYLNSAECSVSEKSLSDLTASYSADSTACILYTSGSTGLPKGVCLAHRSILNRLNWQWKQFDLIGGKHVGAFKTSLNFVDHIAEIFAFVLQGRPLVIIDQSQLKNPPELINTLHQFNVSYFVLVPSLLKSILIYAKMKEELKQKLLNVRQWICSGEALDMNLIELFYDVYGSNSTATICNIYGSTEITADATFVVFNSLEEAKRLIENHEGLPERTVPIGVPLSNCKVFLLDKNLDSIRNEDQVGEIYVGGACVSQGYLNLSNDDKFINLQAERFFKTGDFGYMKNSMIYFTGRVDSQLKINGKKVSLNDLIYTAKQIEGIDQFIPLVYQNHGSKIIIAYYKLVSEKTEEEMNQVIWENLKKSLYDYMLPKYLIKIESVPLLYNGKVNKQLLLGEFKSKLERGGDNGSCELSEISETLFKIMSDSIGLAVQFFVNNRNNCQMGLAECGINSLNSIQIYLSLCTEIKNFSGYMSLEEFISTPNLKELIDKLETRSKSEIVVSSPQHVSMFSIDHTNFKTILVRNKRFRFAKKILKLISDTYPVKSILLKSRVDSRAMFDAYYYLTSFAHKNSDSFLVYDKSKRKCVGGVFIYDLEKISSAQIPTFRKVTNQSVQMLHDIFESIETKYIDKLRGENRKVLKSGMATTNLNCTFNENMAIIDYIETEVVRIASENGYDCILAFNANRLTTDVCLKSKGYVLEEEFQINQLELDSIKYFEDSPDEDKISVCVKYL